MGQGNPRYLHKLLEKLLESSPAENSFRVTEDEKPNVSQHCVLAAWKTSSAPWAAAEVLEPNDPPGPFQPKLFYDSPVHIQTTESIRVCNE